MMRNDQDALGGTTGIVDKLVGNAYDVVKYVAYYVKEIRYVAQNMEDIFRVSQDLRSNVRLTTAINATDAVFEIPLPEGVSAGSVIGSEVLIATLNGDVYSPSETTFSSMITAGKLQVTVMATAPVAFIGAEIRWLLTWNTPTTGI